MAVIKQTIKTQIRAIIEEMNSGDVTKKDPEVLLDQFCDKLADVIRDAILSADVQAGIPVSTAGSATSQTGATTGLGSLL